MKRIFWVIGVLCFLGLSGCTANPVVRTETIVVMPPDTLMNEVIPETPPSISEYTNKTCSDKEDDLAEKFRKQTLKIEACNIQLKSIREWGVNTMQLKNNLKKE